MRVPRRRLNEILSVLWALDTIFTIGFVHRYGLEAEANVWMRWVIAHTGYFGFAVYKASALYFWLRMERYTKTVLWHWLLILFMLPVVYMGGALLMME
jgi:hypothetical protein